MFADNGGADLIGGEIGVQDLHSGGGQGAAAAAFFNDDGKGNLRIVIGGKANKNAVVLGVAADSNGYVGFSGEGGYVRTPTNGLLPNDSAGNSTIGTEDWRFATGYFKSINVKGAVELLGDTPYID